MGGTICEIRHECRSERVDRSEAETEDVEASTAGILVYPPSEAAQSLLTVDSPEAVSSLGERMASKREGSFVGF